MRSPNYSKPVIYSSLGEQLFALVFSNDEDILFVGGGFDVPNYKARVAAVDLGSTTTILANKSIEVEGMPMIWSMLRLPGTDILLAGGTGGLLILFFDGSDFHLLNKLWSQQELSAVQELKLEGPILYGLMQPPGKLLVADFGAAFPELLDIWSANTVQTPQEQGLSQIVSNLNFSKIPVSVVPDGVGFSSDGNTIMLRQNNQLSLLPRGVNGWKNEALYPTSTL